ncbi:MAG: glycosyltransferase family 39 protein [Calditerrivibrio sp.]|nr:glycosyltransferase family 39 protein [Calditerrivibrio sp.]
MEASKQRVVYFIIFFAISISITNQFVTLFETTEARYAEIGREMLVSGDFIEPRLNGIKHFHKPPLTYWAIAAGLKVFGINNFGARFFGALASLITLIFTFKTTKFFVSDEEREFPVYILASSFLFIAVSKIVATDIYLTMFTIITQYFYFNQIYGKRSVYNSICIGIFMGLGFLTKGPIIFIFTILPYFVLKIFLQEFRKVFDIKSILLATLSFTIISLPWYIMVIHKNPELLNYFFKVQTVDRVATDRFHRSKPFYFFFVVIFTTFLPYIFYVVRGIIDLKKLDKKVWVLLTFIAVPFIVFNLSTSKLATYILPFYPLMSVLGYLLFNRYFDIKSFRIFLYFMILLTIFSPSVILFYEDLKENFLLMFIISIVALSFLLYLMKIKDIRKIILTLSIFFISVMSLSYFVIASIEKDINGYYNMSSTMNRIDPDKKIKTLVYNNTIPSLSFYRNSLVVMSYGKERETQFEDNNMYKEYYLTNDDEIKKFIEINKEFFLVTKGSYLKEFSQKFGKNCQRLFSQKKSNLYLCK